MENNQTRRPLRVILSGGGTAGHIYPAVATADALCAEFGGGIDILFVGAEGKMEMERVPQAGYEITGLPVAGLQRKLFSASNCALPYKVWKSLRKAKKILKEFRPDVVAGFGGYASAPILWAAQRAGIPTVIQEQNSYAGLTNRILGRRVRTICTAYGGMERFFPGDRITITGNPLRGSFTGVDDSDKREEGYAFFGLDPRKKTLLVVGGSLGTRTLNLAVLRWLDTLEGQDSVQVVWQSGKFYNGQIEAQLAGRTLKNIWRGPFIERMDLAYAVADAVVSRAGASTVSELELIGRPVIFVPSPNVSEDHQTKNAQALVAQGAAQMIADSEAVERVIPDALALLSDEERQQIMTTRIRALGRPDAARDVAAAIIYAAKRDHE